MNGELFLVEEAPIFVLAKENIACVWQHLCAGQLETAFQRGNNTNFAVLREKLHATGAVLR